MAESTDDALAQGAGLSRADLARLDAWVQQAQAELTTRTGGDADFDGEFGSQMLLARLRELGEAGEAWAARVVRYLLQVRALAAWEDWGHPQRQRACAPALPRERTRLEERYAVTARRGKKRAAIAVGHRILVIAYHLLKRQTTDEELGVQYFAERQRDAVERRLVRRLQGLGYKATLEPAA